LACHDKFFVNNPLDIKENDEHAFDFSRGRIVALPQDHNGKSTLITSDKPGQEGCIIRGDLTKFVTDIDTLLLLIHCEIASGQIHDSKQKHVKNQHFQPDAMTPKVC
jgi:hypothetical protein